MIDFLLILAFAFVLVYGYRLMARLDRFISTEKGRDPERSVNKNKTPSLRECCVMFFCGESLHSICACLPRRHRS